MDTFVSNCLPSALLNARKAHPPSAAVCFWKNRGGIPPETRRFCSPCRIDVQVEPASSPDIELVSKFRSEIENVPNLTSFGYVRAWTGIDSAIKTDIRNPSIVLRALGFGMTNFRFREDQPFIRKDFRKLRIPDLVPHCVNFPRSSRRNHFEPQLSTIVCFAQPSEHKIDRDLLHSLKNVTRF